MVAGLVAGHPERAADRRFESSPIRLYIFLLSTMPNIEGVPLGIMAVRSLRLPRLMRLSAESGARR